MREMPPGTNSIRFADLPAGDTQTFVWEPDGEGRASVAADLGIPAIRKLRLAGALLPVGQRDWRLEAELGATVVQDCVVTFAPVTTRLDEPVLRTYLAEMPDLPAGDEIETPEDETLEPLPDAIDLRAVAMEALSLALPAYPRAEGVEAVDLNVTGPGKAPMTDDEAKPFAGLAALRDQLKGKDG